MRSTLIVLAAGAALLAACSKPAAPGAPAAPGTPGAPAASGPAAPAAAPSAAPGPVALEDLPRPKAGLWHSVTTSSGAGMTTDKPFEQDICMSGKPLNPAYNGPKCATITAARTANGWTIDGDCPNNGMQAKMHVEVAGDFNANYTTDASITLTGGPGGGAPMTMKSHNVLTYKGQCPPGVNPKD